MNKSTLFKLAHAMTKQVIKTGDNYQVTFGLCLKAIKANIKQAAVNNINFAILVIIVLTVIKVVKFLKDSVEPALFFVAIFFNPFSLMIYNGIYLAIVGASKL